MAVNYDLNNTGPEVQARLDQVFPNQEAISNEQQSRETEDLELRELITQNDERAQQVEAQLRDEIQSIADEEDLGMSTVDGHPVIRLKDKGYMPAEFSGYGRRYVRKNIVPITEDDLQSALPFDGFVENVTISPLVSGGNPDAILFDTVKKKFVARFASQGGFQFSLVWTASNYGLYASPSTYSRFANNNRLYEYHPVNGLMEKTEKNLLTQGVLSSEYTIYHIQYDHDLPSTTLNIPTGSIFLFEGGCLKNGVMNGDVSIVMPTDTRVLYNVTVNGHISSIDGRITELEEAVGDGGTVDERIATAVEEETTRATSAENAIKGGSNKSIQNLDNRLSTVEELAEISVEGGSIGIASSEDFTNRTPVGDAKIPTVGAVLDGADEEPTAGSNNLVKSGGVKKELLEKINKSPYKNLFNPQAEDIKNGYYIDSNGNDHAGSAFHISGIAEIKPSTNYYLSDNNSRAVGTAACYIREYDSEMNVVQLTSVTNKQFTTAATSKYLQFSYSALPQTICLEEGTSRHFTEYTPINYPLYLEQFKEVDFQSILGTPNFEKTFKGDGSAVASQKIYLVAGRTYRISFDNAQWSVSSVTGDKFWVNKIVNGVSSVIYVFGKTSVIPNKLIIVAETADYYLFNIKADVGTNVKIYIEDVTDVYRALKFSGNLKIGNAWVSQGNLYYNDTATDRVSTLKGKYVSLHKGDIVSLSSYSTYKLSTLYNNNGTWEEVTAGSGLVDKHITNDGLYAFCVILKSGGTASIEVVEDLLSIKTDNIDTIYAFNSADTNESVKELNTYKPMFAKRLLFKGANTSAVTKQIDTIIGHTYRLYFVNRTWEWSNIGSGNYFFLNNGNKDIFAYSKTYYPRGFQYRDFVAETESHTLSIRANSGIEVEVIVADITERFDTSIVAYNGGYAKMKALYSTLYRPSYGSSSPSRFNLIFFSDIHAGTENCRRIAEFRDTFGFSDVLHGGDDVQDKFTDTNTVANNGGQSFLNIVGNHDVLKTDGIATGLEYYNKFIAPNIDQWGNVVFPENADVEGYCYYYKDYSESKVRLVALDCMHWDSTQKTWFENVLVDASNNNFSVICASHYCPDRFPVFIKDCTFCTLWKDDVNAGLNSEAADAVSNAISNNNLDFICWLFGHTHRDYFVRLSTHSEQYAIGVDRGYGKLAGDDSSRDVGTKFYDSFDLISVDTKSKHLTVVKIGCTSDRLMRQKNYLVFDYANHVIIHNS